MIYTRSHPYYDPVCSTFLFTVTLLMTIEMKKSNSNDPKWFMVDLTFISRVKHFIPLALLRYIADLAPQQLPKEIAYLGDHGVKAIKGGLVINI